jgi:putative addiction module component (TIGR02574 family)
MHRLAFRAAIGHDSLMAKPALDLSKLTANEKLELIDDLWLSLSPTDLEIADETRAELDRRLDRLDREGPVGVDWEDVRAEMTTDRL